MYLELQELTKNYGELTAVDNLNLGIESGELVCIVGPSGSGKSTTLRMVGGFILPTMGQVYLENKDITRFPPHLRPTSTVFQNYALFPHLNVMENVIYGLKRRKIKDKEACRHGNEILETVGLQRYAGQSVLDLSGGEQQRVALARALVTNPKVLLLDEPLSNLDAKLRVRMRREIKDIQTNFNIATLYVTHDQEEALSIADRIVVMNHGKVEQIGRPAEVYHHPGTAFVADFVGRNNFLNLPDGRRISIRPENIRLSLDDGHITGRVMQKQFMGPYTTYFIECGQGIIQVDQFFDATIEIPLGSMVSLQWPQAAEINIGI